MAKVESRIAQVEKEAMFRRWFYFSRFLEGLSEEQIAEIALHWRFPDPLPEPLPWGMSELDKLDRKSLVQRWVECEHEISRIMREPTPLASALRDFHHKLKVEGDEQIGVNIVKRALVEPLRQIAENSGEEGAIVLGKVNDSKENNFG